MNNTLIKQRAPALICGVCSQWQVPLALPGLRGLFCTGFSPTEKKKNQPFLLGAEGGPQEELPATVSLWGKEKKPLHKHSCRSLLAALRASTTSFLGFSLPFRVGFSEIEGA